jgi:hypothetical protein
MATPFKLKSGNASAFKNLGSSPAKGVIPTSSQMPPNWNTKGSSGAGPKIWTKQQIAGNTKAALKDPNIKTVSSKTNVGTKVVDAVPKKPTSVLGKTTNIIKRAGKTILKGASKVILPVAIGAELVDMYTSGQKHSGGKAIKGQKSFMADAKKNQTSIMEEGKKKKSILNKNN